MKREIIIISIILIIVFIVMGINYYIQKSKPSIELFKLQNSIQTREDIFTPLDEVIVQYPTLKSATAAYIQVRDGKGNIYSESFLNINEPSIKNYNFIAGQGLGNQEIKINFYMNNGKTKSVQKNFYLNAETKISSDDPVWNSYYDLMKDVILKNRRIIKVNGRDVTGYRAPDTTPIFLRDHTHQMKGFKYFENEMKSAVDYFLDKQEPNGKYLEILWVNPQSGKTETLRNEMEADPEYLAVQAAYQVWQSTGDDIWIQNNLNKLEKGLLYSITDPYRWSEKYQLVKRPYTIDTWDFEYQNPSRPYDTTQSKMGIMHGDNSGMYDACRKLALLYQYFKNTDKSNYWEKKAEQFKEQLNKICWNGKFYTHRIDIDPVIVKGINTKQILSLSNAYDINRGVTNHQQAVSIIKEYQKRKELLNPPPFVEWFSIQPFFPKGSFETTENSWTSNAGEYVNGGIMPLVGGELARASFEHGYEKYAVTNLEKYFHMVNTTGKAYLWYHWDGKPGISDPTTFSSDGWGAAAMLNAFIEGLVGIVDESKLFEDVKCIPRWTSSNITTATAITKYGSSEGYFAYRYNYHPAENKLELIYTGSGKNIDFSVLLPENRRVKGVFLNQESVPYTLSTIENSHYVDIPASMNNNHLEIVLYNK